MKRISILALVVLFMMSCTVFAADRWYWVSSNDTESVFFDTTTIKFENRQPGHIQFKAWVKFQYNEEGTQKLADQKHAVGDYSIDWSQVSYTLENVSIFLNGPYVSFHGIYYYDSNGSVLLYVPESTPWISTVPGSVGEDIVRTLIIYTANNISSISKR